VAAWAGTGFDAGRWSGRRRTSANLFDIDEEFKNAFAGFPGKVCAGVMQGFPKEGRGLPLFAIFGDFSLNRPEGWSLAVDIGGQADRRLRDEPTPTGFSDLTWIFAIPVVSMNRRGFQGAFGTIRGGGKKVRVTRFNVQNTFFRIGPVESAHVVEKFVWRRIREQVLGGGGVRSTLDSVGSFEATDNGTGSPAC